MNENPVQSLIDDALRYVRKRDPSWDTAQPLNFRAAVVAKWKDNIKTEIFGTSVCWTLSIGEAEFAAFSDLFTRYKTCYNPYGKVKCFCI